MDMALIGCGFIGSLIAEHIANEKIPLKLKLLLDRNPEKVERVMKMFHDPPSAVDKIEEITSSNVSLVIEAASMEAVHSFAIPIISTGKNMMIMSVGAFSTPGFYKKIHNLCLDCNSTVYLPSGAIGGLDAISSASIADLKEVELTTIKNPRSLVGAIYLLEHGIDLSNLKEKTILFSGNASEAVKGFPSNINVALALSLAGIGVKKTRVKIIADPKAEQNIHEIRATGVFGNLIFRTENIPSPENPKTSFLAALSAISTLKRITNPIKIG
jgi:aspartate dehydrogenase